jgi:hypothetical protein
MIAESRISPRIRDKKIQLRRQRFFSNSEHRNSRSFDTQFTSTNPDKLNIILTGHVHLWKIQKIQRFEMIAESPIYPRVWENKMQLRRQRFFSNSEHRNSRSLETQFTSTKLD